MPNLGASAEQKHPNLNLTPEEQRLYAQVFAAADSDSIGVVTGDVALRFLPEKTKLPSEVLGEIWQIADTEDKGFLTPPGFYIILRLVGYAQAGQAVSEELALKSGPIPRFDGINTGPAASPLQAQGSGGAIRVPPLTPDNANKYSQLFQQSGAQNGALSGATAKQIFDRAQLPNDILVKIWNLADTEQRGMLSETEFMIAMHLLACFRNGSLRALPQNLPAGLYEAAARRGVAPPRPLSGSRPQGVQAASAIPRQFSGSSSQRPSSPLSRQPFRASTVQQQPTGLATDWAIGTQEKELYDRQYDKLDTGKQGFVSGEQAVGFFSTSGLAEEDLATVWDLSDITSAGQLSRDEFAVAMHLIRQLLDKRGPLPTSLPPNLVPPSMRSSSNPKPQQAPPQSPPTKVKSAAEDLFGLDELSETPSSTAPTFQSTGDSSAPKAAQPNSLPQPIQPSQSTVFKPFVPSSSFGQSIVSPQPTGASQSSSSKAQPPPNDDDLLGDTDPEINKRITNETTELANLSNQVTNLTNQMQEVKNKRNTTEQNMTQASAQKQDFMARLTTLRSAYEQEARELRGLEERLAQSRNDTRKVQSDLAKLQHSYSNLQEQKQQVAAALEADQKENASLKEQMREVNTEISQLKPLIEKLRSDARQQKGLVAINKKQLSTNESERTRVKSELEAATSEYQDTTKELEESSNELEQQKLASPLPATSPTPSSASQSTNPFFRRTTTGVSLSESARSPLATDSITTPNHSAFDNFFGTVAPDPNPFTPPSQPPPTSFGTSSAEHIKTTDTFNDAGPVDHSSVLTNQKSPVQHDLPSASQPPPPPPQSRQITSSSLPLREAAGGPPSENSSIGVAPPTSRFGDSSGLNTPLTDRQVSQGMAGSTLSPLSQNFTGESTENKDTPRSSSEVATPKEAGPSIPGSFPGESTASTPVPEPSKASDAEDPFAAASPREPSSAKDDFDSAFASFEGKGKSPEEPNPFPQSKKPANDEFPPIQEFDDDDSSDESEKGFDDNFEPSSTPRSPQGAKTVPDKSSHDGPNPSAEEVKPELLRAASSSSQPPTPNAQASPPSYEQTVPPAGQDHSRKDSNQFPAEYTGLLPPRTDPTSSDVPNAIAEDSTLSVVGSQSGGPVVSSAAANPAPPNETSVPGTSGKSEAKNAFDDFDDAFGDLSEAKAADEKGDEDFGSQRDNAFDEFNPTFDSPAPSKATTSSAFQDNAFSEFEASFTNTNQNMPTGEPSTVQPSGSQDWDAMFAGLDSNTQPNGGSTPQQPALDGSSTSNTLAAPAKPTLGRALSTGTEHDDPILKRLTAMGYPRDKSLAALEKFDYNLDKAADYLTSKD